ncbi:hypothetical protein Hanom_Chr10g00904611 [Helianthus anomalus]
MILLDVLLVKGLLIFTCLMLFTIDGLAYLESAFFRLYWIFVSGSVHTVYILSSRCRLFRFGAVRIGRSVLSLLEPAFMLMGLSLCCGEFVIIVV